MLAVMLEGLGLKVELILERRGSHRSLILGPAAFLFMEGLRAWIAECSVRFS